MGTKGIVVVGSLNLDLVVQVERIPSVGETIQGRSFQTHPGGKGANQAAEIGRLGYPVHMIGRIGSDAFGSELRESLDNVGVNTTAVSVSEAASGVAMILVQARGENSIVVAPGANACLGVSDLDANLELIQNASLVLTQLEIPIPTLEHLTALCERECVPLILDPAPAQQLSSGVLSKVTWITPNDTEAQQLTGFEGSTESEQELRSLAERLLEMGPRNVLLKLGSRGAYVATEDGIRAAIPAYSVDAVDTTAAGDAFNGAFAVALARGAAPLDAVQFATAAAAISVTRHGALPSMPTQAEVESFLATQQELAL
jgi:ribokinase